MYDLKKYEEKEIDFSLNISEVEADKADNDGPNGSKEINKNIKLKKIRACFEDEFVRNILQDVNFTDSQIKILCLLMKFKFEEFIYWFFRLKNLINKNALH